MCTPCWICAAVPAMKICALLAAEITELARQEYVIPFPGNPRLDPLAQCLPVPHLSSLCKNPTFMTYRHPT